MQTLAFILSVFVTVSECRMKPYVVGGKDASIRDFPYTAHLLINCVELNEESIYGCGSSILNQYVTLTATHCLFYCTKKTKITISVGNVDTVKGFHSSADNFLLHEEYEQKTAKNDIALVSSRRPLEFSASVSRVSLVPKPPKNKYATLAGWGLYNEKDKVYATQLLYAHQQVHTRKECTEILKIMPLGTFCGHSRTPLGYAAVGDSGSALVGRNNIQIGIVSYKKPDINTTICIYTDTGYFYDWITTNAQKITCYEQ